RARPLVSGGRDVHLDRVAVGRERADKAVQNAESHCRRGAAGPLQQGIALSRSQGATVDIDGHGAGGRESSRVDQRGRGAAHIIEIKNDRPAVSERQGGGSQRGRGKHAQSGAVGNDNVTGTALETLEYKASNSHRRVSGVSARTCQRERAGTEFQERPAAAAQSDLVRKGHVLAAGVKLVLLAGCGIKLP